jgi:serine/threonine protein kinase
LRAQLGGSYRVERELGGGGMSQVFLAEELALGRRVVIKVLPPELASVLSGARFEREIRVAARLQHPHIVPVLAAGQVGDVLYYTMPFVDGESLRARLARETELPVLEAARLLREIADALAYAHREGVVHRDIKPDNILLSHQHAMVTDFGVARAVSEAVGTSPLTQSGMTLVAAHLALAPGLSGASRVLGGMADGLLVSDDASGDERPAPMVVAVRDLLRASTHLVPAGSGHVHGSGARRRSPTVSARSGCRMAGRAAGAASGPNPTRVMRPHE